MNKAIASASTPPRQIEEELAGPALSPVERRSRVTTLDVLRGFALLGILAVNIETFSGPESIHDIPVGMALPAFVGWHAHLDLVILIIKWAFVEGKMRAMFGMLFGAGVVLLTNRIERRAGAGNAADIYVRRNMWLGLFGLIHGMIIWEGDILLQYALCALLFLYPFRRLPGRTLIGLGMLIWIVGGTFGILNFFDAPHVIAQGDILVSARAAERAGSDLTDEQQTSLTNALEQDRARPASIAAAVSAGRAGFWDGLPARANADIDFVYHVFRDGWIAEVVGCMLVGMGLYHIGFLSGTFTERTYFLTAVIGYLITWPIVLVGIWKTKEAGFSDAAALRWMYSPYDVEQAAGMLANAAAVILIVKAGALRWLTNCLAAAGRMAFSNYVATSLICQSLFSWGPYKMFGSLQYYQELFVVLAIWVFNLLISPLWLRWFAFGPLEWLWRSLTYWERQPFRIGARR